VAIATSFPAIILSLMVLKHWFPEARRAVWERRDAADWLVLGVTASFIGAAATMIWWSSYLALTHIGSPSAAWFMRNGTLFNIFSRQLPIIIAAWCHLNAYKVFTKGSVQDPTFQLKWTLAVGALGALVLTLLGG